MTHLENIDTDDAKTPIPLKVELVAELIKRNYKQKDIVLYTRQKHQNVSRFFAKHKEELQFLVDVQDNLAGIGFKRIVYHGQKRQNTILTDAKASKKVSFSQIALGTAVAYDKYRLATNKSTQNISIDSMNTDLDDLTKQAELIEARLEKIASRRITGNQEEIITVPGEEQPESEGIGGEID